MKELKIFGEILFLILLSNVFISGQTDSGQIVDDSAKIRAKEIIEKSRKYKKNTKIENIKSLTVSYESKLPPIDRFEESISNSEINILFPNKIYSYGKSENGNTISISSTILNGDKFNRKMEAYSGGKPINAIFDSGTKEFQIREYKWRVWTIIFPITLDSWFYPFEFNFIAVAESKDGKADVLEAVSSNKTVYRLFFDQNTHLLLMMTRAFQTKENVKVEDKYFFSDYKENGGMIIAHKIEYQQNSELIETITIKSLKINPSLRSDLFDLKEN